jgi:hypothetical protein
MAVSTSAVSTRVGNATDLADVLSLNQHNIPSVNDLSLDKLQTMVAMSACFRVVELDQQFAGFVLTFSADANYASENLRWFKQHHSDFLYLDRVAVADFAKQRGCAKALYQDLEHYCKDFKIGQIALEVNIKPLNQGSLDFHHKLGFKEVGRQETGGGAKMVCLMMKEVSV